MTRNGFTPEYQFTDEEMWAKVPKVPEVMTVTPEIAGNWLDTRAHPNVAHNRRLSKHTVQTYADDMIAGRWRLTHQGIAFDSDGLLVDGQHRLAAIRLAKVTIPMWVHPDMPRDTFAYMDVGRQRRAAQLYDGRHAVMIAGAARWVFPGLEGTYQKGVTVSEVLDNIARWGELETYAPAAKSLSNSPRLPGPAHLAILAQADRTVHRDRIEDWIDGIKTGANLAPGDARLLARDRFSNPSNLLIGNKEASYYTLVKAWNSFVAGERRQVLAWRFTEGVVEVAGYRRAKPLTVPRRRNGAKSG